MPPDIEAAKATVSAIAAAINTGFVLALLVSFLWPQVAAVFADYDGAQYLGQRITRASAQRHLGLIGLIVCLGSGSMLYWLVRFDAWSGALSIAAVFTHSIVAVAVIVKSMHRSTDPAHWLRDHGLTSYEIGVVEKSHALSLLTVSGLYITWAVAVAVPLRLLAGEHAADALKATVISGAVITPLAVGGEVLDRRLRTADQLRLYLKAACHPDSKREPLAIRLTRLPDLTPADLWQLHMPRDRAALLVASTLLQRLLRSRTRRWRGLDQNVALDAAQPIFDDLAALAESRRAIAAAPVITRAVRLGLLGDTSMLRTDWARPHRVSDHRAWNPWSIKRIATVTTGTISVAAATTGSVIAVIKAFTS